MVRRGRRTVSREGGDLTAAIYIPRAHIYHARLDCDARVLRRRGLVALQTMLLNTMRPCSRCWRDSGYAVSQYPEPWEESLV
jgi:hypothetical protein